jgi:hypothetical protein
VVIERYASRTMAERTRRAGADPDNWFDPQELSSDARAAGARSAVSDAPGPMEEDWLADGHEDEPDPWRKIGALVRQPQVAAGVALVVALVVGLALLGVFDGGKPKAAPTSTLPPVTTPAAASPTKTTARRVNGPTVALAPGATGTQVQALQRALSSLGYPAGTADGVYGKSTTDALSAFQAKAGLTPDGVLGPLTLQALTNALAP